MEEFYAALNDETSMVSPNDDSIIVSELINKILSEETKKALKTIHDYVAKDFSVLLSNHEYKTIVESINYLTSLSTEDGVSVETRVLIRQVSRQLTCWHKDYTHEGSKIESSTAKLLRCKKLEEGLEANKINFKEAFDLENESCNELVHLEQRKKELEEQLDAVTGHISFSQISRDSARKRKRETFEEANILKSQRDELREQVPHLRLELVLAKNVQASILDEWSKLGEKFNNSIRHMGFD